MSRTRPVFPGATLLALLCLLLPIGLGADVTLRRATVTVNDMEASIAFYRDVLGFTVSGDARYDTPALRSMFHVPDAATPRLVLLDAGPDQPRALALIAAEGLAVDSALNARHAPALVFDVTDMDALHERLVDADARVVQPPTPLRDFSGKPFGREAMVLDPNGVRIVFFEAPGGADD